MTNKSLQETFNIRARVFDYTKFVGDHFPRNNLIQGESLYIFAIAYATQRREEQSEILPLESTLLKRFQSFKLDKVDNKSSLAVSGSPVQN
jgi:hypothetical protein